MNVTADEIFKSPCVSGAYAKDSLGKIISSAVCEGYGIYWVSKKIRIGRGLLGLARPLAFI